MRKLKLQVQMTVDGLIGGMPIFIFGCGIVLLCYELVNQNPL